MKSNLPSLFASFFLCFLVLWGSGTSGHGQVTPSQMRLFSLNPASETSLGEVVAASRTHVVAGNPKSGPPIPVAFGGVGSISVFNASTGQRIRQTFAPAIHNNGEFGAALALQTLLNGINIIGSIWFGLVLGWAIERMVAIS